jgi:hypothetical protein
MAQPSQQSVIKGAYKRTRAQKKTRADQERTMRLRTRWTPPVPVRLGCRHPILIPVARSPLCHGRMTPMDIGLRGHTSRPDQTFIRPSAQIDRSNSLDHRQYSRAVGTSGDWRSSTTGQGPRTGATERSWFWFDSEGFDEMSRPN